MFIQEISVEDIQPVVLSCSKCGGTQLIADANAVWNSLSNSWQLDGVHDSIFCNGCDSETRDVIKRAVFDNWPDAKRFAINETCPWGHAWITSSEHTAPFTVFVCDNVAIGLQSYAAEFKDGAEQ